MTIGNSPGYTYGIKCVAIDQFCVFDSHSRDDQVEKLLFFEPHLWRNLKDMSQSISSSLNLPFEITPVLITASGIASKNI